MPNIIDAYVELTLDTRKNQEYKNNLFLYLGNGFVAQYTISNIVMVTKYGKHCKTYLIDKNFQGIDYTPYHFFIYVYKNDIDELEIPESFLSSVKEEIEILNKKIQHLENITKGI